MTNVLTRIIVWSCKRKDQDARGLVVWIIWKVWMKKIVYNNEIIIYSIHAGSIIGTFLLKINVREIFFINIYIINII